MKFNNKTLKKAIKEWLDDDKLAESKYGDISNWDTSNVTDMSKLFYRAGYFNEDLSSWDVGNVINMYGMFDGANSFNKPIGTWNVSSVINMRGMFCNAYNFNHDISQWDVSNCTDMSMMFCNAGDFNHDISQWDVSNCTDMSMMFELAYNFNQDIGLWDVSKVTKMKRMFEYAKSFNQDIGIWNVGNVNDMSEMFIRAIKFNQDLSEWKILRFCKINNMFNWADSFNLDNQPSVTSVADSHSKSTKTNETQVKDVEIDYEIWIAMEKSEFLDIDDNTFEALELTIQFSDEGDGEHELIETIKNEMNFENLVFTEYQDDSGEFKLQKVINCPEIQDTDNYGDAGHHGPFSTTEEVVDYLKKLKTINFDELDLYTDSMD